MAGGDDAFWREQEARPQKLEQPCCTQSNISWSLVDMPGDLAVVVHGESDCLNCFFRHLGRSTTSYYSTRLSERQLIGGDTGQPLRRLLRLIVRQRRPEAVLVLGTCPIEIIGDPFEAVVDEVSRDSGIPMRALRTHGLALMSQARSQDWLCSELAELSAAEPPGERIVNIVGLPRSADRVEMKRLLAAAGLEVNGCYPNGTSIAEWRAIRRAPASFVVDREMFPRLCGTLAGWGQRLVDVPLPVGVEPTARFYRAVAEAFGVRPELDRMLDPQLEDLQAGCDRLAARAHGRRLAICVRMVKTHRSDRLAYDGLGELPMLRSFGFDIGILVQGPPEDAARARFAQRLDELGYSDVSFDVFEGPWKLGERLRRGGFVIAVMSDVAQNVVEQAGIRMIFTGDLQPLLAGMHRNMRLIGQVLDDLP